MCLLELIRLQTRKMKVKMSSNLVDFPLFGMCLPKAKNNALHGLILLSFVFTKLTICKTC